MVKFCKTILCSLFSAFFAFSSVSCSVTEPSDVETTVAPTSAEQTTSSTESKATDDIVPANHESYNYLLIKQDFDDITAMLDKIISSKKYKGTTYLKIGNDFEYINANGDANTDKHMSNSIDTCYYTGSVTKQFTAAAVLKLCEDKKLSLSDTLDKFFSSYKKGEKITVRNLLTMTSGIKNYVKRDNETDSVIILNPEIEAEISKNNSKKENKKAILDWIFKQDLSFEPDSEFMYSDSNYYLLGEIIEKAGGKSYEKYLEDNIFKPLGMNSSSFEAGDKTAVSYQGTNSNDSLLFSGVGYSSMGLISNISDLLKWVDGLLDGAVLSEDSLEQMFTPYKENYAMGFYVYGNKLSHTGRTEDYNSMLSFTKDKSEIFVSLSNYAYADSAYIYRLFKNSLKKYLN